MQNREIKFRAAIKDEYLGLFYMFNDGWYKWGILDDISKDKKYIDTNTIGQFTGLRDINGKEIYEGDIYERIFYEKNKEESVLPHPEVIKFVDSLCAWDISTMLLYNELMKTVPSESKCVFKIIGSVYKNPELLKDKKDE
jgi:uncharacterized phage protein (TIGR01671 family)